LFLSTKRISSRKTKKGENDETLSFGCDRGGNGRDHCASPDDDARTASSSGATRAGRPASTNQ
jgi:hypothetical protein